ncbi:phasin family protein [Chachezhania antarctica]|uniref:phasin family protein n=1 Tax=Chachezhania antarctica TaxID=2340860 RepID=UPI000EAFEB53|nr:phasin family protein [Chachezhania antarctica]|tara:strand:- start:2833 stop:3258 length:426 start_codon:yes stop_codon:yes gene_type:complete
MAKQTTPDSPANGPASPDVDASAALKLNRQLFHAGAHVQARVAERMARLGQEHLSFVARRLDRDRAFIGELADVGHPGETIGHWAAFTEETQKDYSEEWQRMLGLWTDTARQTSADLHDHFNETIGAALKRGTTDKVKGDA